MEKPAKPQAKWDPTVAKVFNKICVEQVLAHNRPNNCLNNVGYANLVKKLFEQTLANEDYFESVFVVGVCCLKVSFLLVMLGSMLVYSSWSYKLLAAKLLELRRN